MNREKKEAARKHREARAGLSAREIEALDREEAVEAEIAELARTIHHERFPEEFDRFGDSVSDAADRNRGVNPMAAEYIARVAAKRKAEGVPPLSEVGLPTGNETLEQAYREASTIVRGRLRRERGSE